MRKRLCILVLGPLLAACTTFPDLDKALSDDARAADYPRLVPLPPLLEDADATRVDAKQIEDNLTARIDRLRARAARLRGPVLRPSERARLAGRPA